MWIDKCTPEKKLTKFEIITERKIVVKLFYLIIFQKMFCD